MNPISRLLAASMLLTPFYATGQEKAHLELDSPFASFIEERTPYQ